MKYFFILAIFFSFSFAHKLNLFVTNENDSLEIYSYLSKKFIQKYWRIDEIFFYISNIF
jgi:hypothetical protein